MSNLGRHLRKEEVRRRALADLERQVEAGTLVIRQATAEERAKWPPPEDRPARHDRPPHHDQEEEQTDE